MKTTKMLLGTIVVAAMASCSNNEPDDPTIGRILPNRGWGGLYDGFYYGHSLLLPDNDSYDKNRINVHVEK